MKNAEEVLHKWYQPIHISNIATIEIVEAMKEYAKLAIEEQLKIVADKAKTESITEYIRNCTRIELK